MNLLQRHLGAGCPLPAPQIREESLRQSAGSCQPGTRAVRQAGCPWGRPRIQGRTAGPGWGCSLPMPLEPHFKVPALHSGDPGVLARCPRCQHTLMSIYTVLRSCACSHSAVGLGSTRPQQPPHGMQALPDAAGVPTAVRLPEERSPRHHQSTVHPLWSSCSPGKPLGCYAGCQSPAHPTVPRSPHSTMSNWTGPPCPTGWPHLHLPHSSAIPISKTGLPTPHTLPTTG